MRGGMKARVLVLLKPQNDWSGSEICEIWTQKNCPIPVILWIAFLHISPFKIISINVVTSCIQYPYWFISLLLMLHVLIHCEFSFDWQTVLWVQMTSWWRISKNWPNHNTIVCPFYLNIILILFIKFRGPWLTSIILTNMILIISMVVYLCRIFTVLRTN